jgi:PAS domain S-box-containing protein
VQQHPATILFVDDDVDSRQALGCLIRDAGYSLLEANTAEEALQLCRAHRPDLVILDVNLPDRSGYEVCRLLRADPATGSLAIVHLSAVFVASNERSLGLEGGADAYLVKPIEPRELLATIRALMRIRTAEEIARRVAGEWRTTFDAISDVVCLVDSAGRVCRCNKALCELVGRKFDEVIGQGLDEVLCEGLNTDYRLQIADCRLEDAQAGRQAREVQLGARWFRVTVDPICGDAGSSVVILTDVTQRKRLEERLLQAQRLEAVGRLAGGIAHDFNNLLTAVLGNASLLLQMLPPDEREHQLTAAIDRAAWRAAELTRQLLGFSRQALLFLRAVEPGTVLDEAVAQLKENLPPTIRLLVQRAPTLGNVLADTVQLEQVLAALCRNAVEAMPRGGELLLSAAIVDLGDDLVHGNPEARPGRFVRLRVQDTGPGIPAEVRDKIFDPFFTTKPVGQGTGLALAMVYGILKQHQGWVECHSDPTGTRFDLYLPVASDPPSAVSEQTPSPPPRLVLLADDNDSVRSLAAAYLRQAGFEVLQAADGQEAVAVFQRNCERIDLVILDQMMPHLTGSDALGQMRRIRPAVRALLVSGSVGADLPGPGEVQGVITKPYRQRELLQAVQQALQ